VAASTEQQLSASRPSIFDNPSVKERGEQCDQNVLKKISNVVENCPRSPILIENNE
jgi:hypothetical protein